MPPPHLSSRYCEMTSLSGMELPSGSSRMGICRH
jgi:hypothetical protein